MGGWRGAWQRWWWGWCAKIALAVAAHSQGQDELSQLFAEVSRLHGQGKSADAISVAERAVAIARERHGEEHAEFGSALGWLPPSMTGPRRSGT